MKKSECSHCGRDEDGVGDEDGSEGGSDDGDSGGYGGVTEWVNVRINLVGRGYGKMLVLELSWWKILYGRLLLYFSSSLHFLRFITTRPIKQPNQWPKKKGKEKTTNLNRFYCYLDGFYC